LTTGDDSVSIYMYVSRIINSELTKSLREYNIQWFE